TPSAFDTMRRMSWGRMRWAAFAAATLASACSSSPTELVVLVGSDYRAGADLSELDARILDEGAKEIGGHLFTLSTLPISFAARPVPIPFAVPPPGGGPRAHVTIHPPRHGSSLDLDQSLRTGFIAGEMLLVPIYFARACQHMSCPSSDRCDLGSCVPADVDPSAWEVIQPGDELNYLFPPSLDAGTVDGDASDGGFGGDGAQGADAAATDLGGGSDGGGRDAQVGSDGGTCTGLASLMTSAPSVDFGPVHRGASVQRSLTI